MRITPFIIVFCYVLFQSCANMIAPAGGPKDETPPQVRSSTPLNNQLNYTDNQIIFTFDEYFTVEKLADELIVSPALKHKPEHTIKGKKLTLTWTDTLKENTTYTFFFGSSIKDVNEGNLLENLSITFSTGNDIDSATYNSQVSRAYGEEEFDPLFVFLSNKPLDSHTFFPVVPLYQTKATKGGNFRFQGLKEGNYFIYFLEDKNKNLKADPNEWIGYDTVPIHISYPEPVDSILQIDTTLQAETPDSSNLITTGIDSLLSKKLPVFTVFPYLVSQKRFINNAQFLSPNHLQIVPQKNCILTDVSVAEVIDNDTIYSNYVTYNKDSINVYYNSKKDRQLLIYNNNQLIAITDTLKATGKRLILTQEQLERRNDSFVDFFFNYPIQFADSQKMVFKQDSIFLPVSILLKDQVLRVYTPLVTEEKLSLEFLDSALHYGDTLFSKKYPPITIKKTLDLTTLSSYEFTLNKKETTFKETPLIFIIESDKKRIVKLLSSDTNKVKINELEEGSYSVQIIADLDGNGVWSSGIIDILSQPEAIKKMPTKLEIKAGWDGEMTIDL
jgi:uncharacterized protein (DUF2141 family)